MGIWKANIASQATAHNLLSKIKGMQETAELVEKIEFRFGDTSKAIFFYKSYIYICVY